MAWFCSARGKCLFVTRADCIADCSLLLIVRYNLSARPFAWCCSVYTRARYHFSEPNLASETSRYSGACVVATSMDILAMFPTVCLHSSCISPLGTYTTSTSFRISQSDSYFGPWGIFGADVTSGCFVTLDEVVTSTAICTNSSFSFRPEPLGFAGSAPNDRPLVILLSAATLLFTVPTNDGRVIDSLWNLFSRPPLMIQRRAYGSRSPAISSIQSGRQASYTCLPPSHSLKSRTQASHSNYTSK
jgi:hypothetical protein